MAESPHFRDANLSGANLTLAVLEEANLNRANLRLAVLEGPNLQGCSLIHTDLTSAVLTSCRVYGVSAWNLELDKTTKQQDLIITHESESEITVDNIEVAQFIGLLLSNEKIRDVIDTIGKKAVLILGRFTEERKLVLDALREELRKRGYLPILFDFEKPSSRSTDETATLLARMARFVVADISDAKSVLQELRAIVPDLPSVPVQPILGMQEEPGMFDFFKRFPWFLPTHRYETPAQLLVDQDQQPIAPIVRELQAAGARSLRAIAAGLNERGISTPRGTGQR
jgi:Pentapeptide repeats (8 copies)